MDTIYQGLLSVDIHAALSRNIVSLRVSENLFDDLSGVPEDWQHAIQLELQTKPPIFEAEQPIIHRPFEDAHWNNAIGYPFKHASQSRYSDGSFGVWYGGDTIETTVHETVYHWRYRFLADAGYLQPGIVGERKVYNVQCDGLLYDFREAGKVHPEILHPTDYSACQAIGQKLHRESQPGLISHSARCNGDVYAIFNPALLSAPQHVCFLTYTTTTQGVEVCREPSKVWVTI